MATRYMLFDRQRCFGCNACVVACQQEYGLPAAIKFNKVDVAVNMAAPNIQDKVTFRPLLCNQCDPAPCLAICPVNAISRHASGVVLTNSATCIGCRLCTTATGCPYNMRSMDGTGKAVKCNFCLDRLTVGESAPYCVKTCPSGARRMQSTEPDGAPLPSLVGAAKVYYGTIT